MWNCWELITNKQFLFFKKNYDSTRIRETINVHCCYFTFDEVKLVRSLEVMSNL